MLATITAIVTCLAALVLIGAFAASFRHSGPADRPARGPRGCARPQRAGAPGVCHERPTGIESGAVNDPGGERVRKRPPRPPAERDFSFVYPPPGRANPIEKLGLGLVGNGFAEQRCEVPRTSMTSDPVEWDDPRELAEPDQLPELPKPAVSGTGSSAPQCEREAGPLRWRRRS